MNIILSDNSNTLFSSYLKGWEQALRTFEEEAEFVGKKYKSKLRKEKK